MKVSLLYRIASVLLLLLAAEHTIGFRQVDPVWRVDSLVDSMKSTHFNANGSDRTYWEFFVGFGPLATALLGFAAIVAWQLGSLTAEPLAQMRVVAWGFVICVGIVTWLSWRYFFLIPVIFIAILHSLAAAPWSSGDSHLSRLRRSS